MLALRLQGPRMIRLRALHLGQFVARLPPRR
jgi:hypothetical protein